MLSLHWASRLTHGLVFGSANASSNRIATTLSRAALAAAIAGCAVGVRAQSPNPALSLQQPGNMPQAAAAQPVQQEHPLVPALKMAYATRQNMDSNLRDYSATVVKHERIDGKMGDQEYAFIKVRQQPFSVYMYFMAPERLKGQECMYIDGKNDGNMFAHAPPGTLKGRFGTVSLSPTSAMAMKDQRYPITELGISNLTKRLIEVGEKDKQYGECDVKFFQGAKVNGQECTMIQVVHPVPRRNFIFHMARIYLDTQLNVPIRYEAYDWPAQPGGEPVKLEEYTYMNLKLNQGFTDADFDVRNPAYKFNMK